MAITRQSFRNIPSSGIIPEEMLPASAFAVSFAFTYEAEADLSTFNKSFSGEIRLHVLDSSNVVKYVIEIEEAYNVFIIPLAPGLAIFTWNWVPSAEEIHGRKGLAEDALPMRTLGEGTFGVEPAEGSGTTSGTVIVDSRFYSGIFQEPLEAGDKIKIVFHNLSAGYVVSRASLQLATERSLLGIDTSFDRANALLHARAGYGGQRLFTGRAWPGYLHADAGLSVEGTDPSIVELPDGREIVACKTRAGEYVEFISYCSEWDWQRVRYPDAVAGFGTTPLPLWPQEARVPILAAFGSTRVTIAVLKGDLLSRRVTDGGVAEQVRVMAADPQESYSISADASGVFWISDTSGLPVAVSRDDGIGWQAIPKEVAV